jgi:hypothetical protein
MNSDKKIPTQKIETTAPITGDDDVGVVKASSASGENRSVGQSVAQELAVGSNLHDLFRSPLKLAPGVAEKEGGDDNDMEGNDTGHPHFLTNQTEKQLQSGNPGLELEASMDPPPVRQERLNLYHESDNESDGDTAPGAQRVGGSGISDVDSLEEEEEEEERDDENPNPSSSNDINNIVTLEAVLVQGGEENTYEENRQRLEQQIRDELLQSTVTGVASPVRPNHNRRKSMILVIIGIVVGIAPFFFVGIGWSGSGGPSTSVRYDSCEYAHGPFFPTSFVTIQSYNYDRNFGVVNSNASACFDVEQTRSGVWYNVLGTGSIITASTCSQETTFDTQLSVFQGNCSNLECVNGNNNFCGTQSTIKWPSILNETYYIVVHGANNANSTGAFTLTLLTSSIF